MVWCQGTGGPWNLGTQNPHCRTEGEVAQRDGEERFKEDRWKNGRMRSDFGLRSDARLLRLGTIWSKQLSRWGTATFSNYIISKGRVTRSESRGEHGFGWTDTYLIKGKGECGAQSFRCGKAFSISVAERSERTAKVRALLVHPEVTVVGAPSTKRFSWSCVRPGERGVAVPRASLNGTSL